MKDYEDYDKYIYGVYGWPPDKIYLKNFNLTYFLFDKVLFGFIIEPFYLLLRELKRPNQRFF